MSQQHVVRQGESISSIAFQYGFSDFRVIWDHPDNSEIKSKRENPNVLYPGDRLTIPDKEVKKESGDTEQTHRFRMHRQSFMLRLVVTDQQGEIFPNTECTLQVENERHELSTDSNGLIEQQIRYTARQGTLTILDREISIEIGHLDPVDEISGQYDRLNNLGYNAGQPNDNNEQQFLSAVEEFQCDHNLTIDGICGPDTQAKLKEIHGC